MSLELPKTFELTRVSPTIQELEFMHDWCKNNIAQHSNVLEFGAGPSTWAISTAINPNKYVSVEDWEPAIKDVVDHINNNKNINFNIDIVRRTWYDIPDDIKYDFVFVDSSAGYPPGATGLHRDEAAKYGDSLLASNGTIMIHDWHKRSGKKPRIWLENNGFKLVDSFHGRTGVGVFQRC